MELDHLISNAVEFPGRAGDLQRSGATASLIRELGDNYARYHEFLEQRLEDFGGDPNPDDYRDDPSAYGRHAHALQRVAISERILRRARAFRREGRPLSDPGLDQPPTWDAQYRLVDVEHPELSRFSAPWERPSWAKDPQEIARLASWLLRQPPTG
jgi:hypothetical protein